MQHQSVALQANKVVDRLAIVFELFGQCHRGYNSGFNLSDRDIDKLGKKVIIIIIISIPLVLTIVYINRSRHCCLFEILPEEFPPCVDTA